ncbi:MAG: efflux RND transporter permease subunit [Planctomycetota bacterium]
MTTVAERNGILGWFAGNPVAANLLMIIVLAAGLISLATNNLEIFPEIDTKIITITMEYRGASPEEVEEGVCVKIEEAIAGIEGIKKLSSLASEGGGVVTAELEDYADTQEVLDDIKAEVDRITTFPEETEKAVISKVETRAQVISIVIYGDTSRKVLKRLAERIRDDLTAMPNISQVTVSGVPAYEIGIEVSEENLRKYGLSFDKVTAAVRNSSLDIPAGSVKTQGGEVLVRTKGQRYVGSEFESIVVLHREDGTKLRLGDIAAVIDGFEETNMLGRFDGVPAAMVNVYRIGDQDALEVAAAVKNYIAKESSRLPAGLYFSTWFDHSIFLKDRVRLLTRNAFLGLVLVFLCLTLFLDLRLAFWTTMGIPISFLGAFWLMPMFDVTINMLSLFALIVCLGIVVDDAIVVGENIFTYRQQQMTPLMASIKGVKEMWLPVTGAVLTTIFAFVPLLYTKGLLGRMLRTVPIVVISVLSISLLEALIILPAHLSGALRRRKPGPIARFQRHVRVGLERFVEGPFARTVEAGIRRRYVTLAIGVSIFLISLGLVKGGYVKFTFISNVDADNVWASLSMPLGTPYEQTEAVAKFIEKAAEKTREQIDAKHRNGRKSIVKHIATNIGSQPFSQENRGPGLPGVSAASAHLAEVNVELLSGEERNIASAEFAKLWRQNVGEIAGVSSLTFTYSLFSAGDAIKVELSHMDFNTLLLAVEELKNRLREYVGVEDISDDFEIGKKELKLNLKDEGRTLGLSLADLARQVRQGFYGEEAQRIQRGRDDIRVMIRYPESQRKSLADIENMRIRLTGGTEVPFNTVADVTYGRGYSSIKRADRKRVVYVTADVDASKANAEEINNDIFGRVLPELKAKYAGLSFGVEGEQKSRAESMGSLGRGFVIALLSIFAILAIQFRSYVQPVIVMSAIPFGLIGALIGHIVMGLDLSLLSIFGIVALAGIVVNDSLIMIDLINRERREGIGLDQVVRDSATRRFRPILLTTLTTFFGLVPMIVERSLQAQFLIPMAVSLAFGVLFATCITLLLVPSLYMILEDIKRFGSRIRKFGIRRDF